MIGLISIIVPSQTETGLRSLFQAATPVGQKPLYLNRDSFRGSSPRLRWSYILYGEPRKLEFLNAKPEALKAQPSAKSPILRMPRVQETPKLHLLCRGAPSAFRRLHCAGAQLGGVILERGSQTNRVSVGFWCLIGRFRGLM